MSWRTVCITQRCKLEFRMGYLVIRKEETQRIHLSEIAALIIESTAISLTTNLLNELNKLKIKVIFCDENHNPYGELVQYYRSHDTSRSVRNQVTWEDDLKALIWQDIVREKILNQATNLKTFKHYLQADLIESYVMDTLPGDSTNREGHAAKVYFNALFGKDFSRDDENPINASLNYGYTLLLGCFNREVTASGRMTQLGIWHNNIFNHFNLSSDLMEVFRPIVDKYVLDIGIDEAKDFSKEIKYSLLNILNLDVSIEGKIQKLPNAIKIYCHHIFKSLDEKTYNPILKIKYV